MSDFKPKVIGYFYKGDQLGDQFNKLCLRHYYRKPGAGDHEYIQPVALVKEEEDYNELQKQYDDLKARYEAVLSPKEEPPVVAVIQHHKTLDVRGNILSESYSGVVKASAVLEESFKVDDKLITLDSHKEFVAAMTLELSQKTVALEQATKAQLDNYNMATRSWDENKALKDKVDYLELEIRGFDNIKNDLAKKLGCEEEPRWKWILLEVDNLLEFKHHGIKLPAKKDWSAGRYDVNRAHMQGFNQAIDKVAELNGIPQPD